MLLGLIQGLAEYERLADTVRVSEEDLFRALFGPNKCAEAVMALWDDEVAGFALFFQTFSTFAGRPGLYLEDVFVLPEMRGLGIGRALLSHLARIATDRGCARFEWAVLDWNEDAIAFYRGLGAAAMSDWTVYRMEGQSLATLAAE